MPLMKKIIAIIFILISFIETNAQFSSGNAFVGGGISYRVDDREISPTYGYRDRVLSVSPSIGFFVTKNLAIGPQVGVELGRQNFTSPFFSYQVDTENYSIGGMAQRFFAVSDKFMFSLVGTISYVKVETFEGLSSDPVSDDPVPFYFRGDGIRVFVTPSFLFFPSERWGFEASAGGVGYSYIKSNENDGKSTSFSSSLGTLNFGIKYFFLNK